MKTFKKLFSIYPQSKKYFTIGISLCIITSIISIVTPLLIAKSIDNAIYNLKNKNVIITPLITQNDSKICTEYYLCPQISNNLVIINNNKSVMNYLLIVLILFILNAILEYFQNVSLYHLARNITQKLRQKVYNKIHKIPIAQFSKSTNGEIISLITNDIEAINISLASDLSEAISAIIIFIGILIAMLSMNFSLSLIILFTIPISFGILLIILHKSENIFKINQQNLASYNSLIEQAYSGHNIICYYNAEKTFIKKQNHINIELQKSSWKSSFLGSLAYSLTQFISNITFIITCIIGAFLIIKGKISLGQLQAFITYTKNINEPLLNLSSLSTTLETINAATKRIFEFLELTEEKKELKTNYSLNGSIEFNNVSFSYNEQPTLKNINFKIEPGEKVAIVGATGSGKTTIIKLLLKFYQPSNGSISINNTNIQKINRHNLRDNINVIMQEHWLFNSTIKDNLIYNNKINLTKYIKKIKRLPIYNTIQQFPNQDNYLINENATNLSLGEKQILTIARATLKTASIIILDEATSNLDSYTEKIISESLLKLMHNKTVIIIAHRLNTIKNVDKIIVLNRGEIVEIGNHQELINKKGHYYHMYNDH